MVVIVKACCDRDRDGDDDGNGDCAVDRAGGRYGRFVAITPKHSVRRHG